MNRLTHGANNDKQRASPRHPIADTGIADPEEVRVDPRVANNEDTRHSRHDCNHRDCRRRVQPHGEERQHEDEKGRAVADTSALALGSANVPLYRELSQKSGDAGHRRSKRCFTSTGEGRKRVNISTSRTQNETNEEGLTHAVDETGNWQKRDRQQF